MANQNEQLVSDELKKNKPIFVNINLERIKDIANGSFVRLKYADANKPTKYIYGYYRGINEDKILLTTTYASHHNKWIRVNLSNVTSVDKAVDSRTRLEIEELAKEMIRIDSIAAAASNEAATVTERMRGMVADITNIRATVDLLSTRMDKVEKQIKIIAQYADFKKK
jgi:hypothetical protein